MDIDDIIHLLEGLIKFLDEYRETGFSDSMDEAKEMAHEMGIEPVFREKCIVREKKQFDENESEEMRKSPEESFRIDYFLHIVDQAQSSLQTKFEQFKQYEEIFGFLLNWERLKHEPSSSFLKSCMKLEKYLEFNGHSDIDEDDLCSELLCLKSYLPREATRAIKVLQYLKKMDDCSPKCLCFLQNFANHTSHSYNFKMKFLQIKVDQDLLSDNYVSREIEWISYVVN